MTLSTTTLPLWPVLAALLGLLTIWGVGLLMADDAPFAGVMPLFAVLITLMSYAATGFALHFGGIGILIDHPDVAALVWEWTPLRSGDLAQWGAAGWMGFGMAQAQTPLAALLFLAALPGAAIAALAALHSFWRHLSPAAGVIMAVVTAALLAPLVGNWLQGGGWLMHLGESIGAGMGYVDFGGASFFLLAGGVALAALLAGREPLIPSPSAPQLSLPALGLGLMLVGGGGWLLASPLHLWQGSSPVQVTLNVLLSLAAGGAIGLLYSWFAERTPESALTARSAAAAWIASLAVAPWLTPLQALLVGAVAAWLFILDTWFLHDYLGWSDPAHGVAMMGLPALWGLLATGFFTPLPGQFRAQLLGAISILLLGFFAGSLVWLLMGWRKPRSAPADIEIAPSDGD